MFPSFIIGLMVAGLVLLLIIKLISSSFKAIAKILSFIISLFILAALICLVVVIRDANEFKSKISTVDSIYVLEDGGFFVAGIRGVSGEGANVTFLTSGDLSNLYTDYRTTVLAEAPSGIYKVFIVTKEALESATIPDHPEQSFSKTKYLEMLQAPDPRRAYAEYQADLQNSSDMADFFEGQVSAQYGAVEFKGLIFSELFFRASQADRMFLMNQYKSGRISVVPDSALFTAIRYIPLSIFEGITTAGNAAKRKIY
jgi:hypothetical protein